MPTAMKNRPRNRPLNGSMCDSSSCRNSESASSTPARNAPRPIDSPAHCINHAVPTTTSSALALNTSTICARATTRNSCRSTKRPPITTAAITTTALSTDAIGGADCASALAWPSSGMAASSGIATRSWNSRIANATRPWSAPSSLRSASSCRPTAVDDSARPRPMISGAFQPTVKKAMTPPMAAADSSTCSPPVPNTLRRSTHSRAGDSSRPMMKSIITTPNSDAASTSSGSGTSFSPSGPMATPATR